MPSEKTTTAPHEAPPAVTPPPSVTTTLGTGEHLSTRLYVDEAHPFFFDHPVDHVPAMLLLAGLLDLAAPAAGTLRPDAQVRLALNVPRMAELNAAVELDAHRATPAKAHWRVTAYQNSAQLAEGTLDYLPGRAPVPYPTRIGAPRTARAERALVHRHRPENVVIGHAHLRDEHLTAPLLGPAPDHYLSLRRPVTGSIEPLVEAGRQFGILYGHVVQARPADSRMLLLGLGAELPVMLPPGALVTLRAVAEPDLRSRGRLVISYHAGGAQGAVIGELRLDYVVVSAAAYHRMRAAGASS